MAEHEPSAGKGGGGPPAGHESFGGEARARDEDAVGGEPVREGRELAVPAAQTRPAAASYRTTAKAPSVSWRSPRVVRRRRGGGCRPGGGVVAREERVGGDTPETQRG